MLFEIAEFGWCKEKCACLMAQQMSYCSENSYGGVGGGGGWWCNSRGRRLWPDFVQAGRKSRSIVHRVWAVMRDKT